jgi:hypothetical protein
MKFVRSKARLVPFTNKYMLSERELREQYEFVTVWNGGELLPPRETLPHPVLAQHARASDSSRQGSGRSNRKRSREAGA